MLMDIVVGALFLHMGFHKKNNLIRPKKAIGLAKEKVYTRDRVITSKYLLNKRN